VTVPYLIACAYLAMCLLLFRLSVECAFDPLRRLKFYALAFGTMCMGSGRFLYAMAPEKLPTYDWIFVAAHLSWICFLGLHIYSVRESVTTWPRRP
jgi:hypothetical protein